MFLDPIFDPLLKLEPVVALLILSFLISLIITVIYMLFTDQKKMKKLKEDLKNYQKELRDASKNPKKMMDVQHKAMEANMEYFRASLKPTLITFIPIILIFGWMGANMEFLPIHPGEMFVTEVQMQKAVTGEISLKVPDGITLLDNATKEIGPDGLVRWELKAPEGTYTLEYNYRDETVTKDILVTSGFKYLPARDIPNSKRFKEIDVIMERIHPLSPIKLLGWQPGWLGTYIIFSLIFSFGLRKVLKVN